MTAHTTRSTKAASTPPASDCASSLSTEEMAEIATLCRSRAAAYAMLARLFRVEVDEDCLEQLRAMRFPVNTGNEDADEGYRLIARYLSRATGDVITELAADYLRTFIGHGTASYSAAYPYESVYTSKKRLLMQGSRDEVLAIYRANGFEKDPTWTTGEDHIALELEFLGKLCERTAEALDKGDAASADILLATQKTFLGDHVASWAPQMANIMKRFAQTDFYLGLSSLCKGFLAIDGELLDELVENDDAAL